MSPAQGTKGMGRRPLSGNPACRPITAQEQTEKRRAELKLKWRGKKLAPRMSGELDSGRRRAAGARGNALAGPYRSPDFSLRGPRVPRLNR